VRIGLCLLFALATAMIAISAVAVVLLAATIVA